jgi:mannose-6-phosphate isomerase-like protein (cupin superfamily)
MSSRTPKRKTTITVSDRAPAIRAYGDEARFNLGSNETGGRVTVFTDTTPPSGGPPPHFHTVEDEWWFVLEGRAEFFHEGSWTEVRPGGCVFMPKNTVHAFRNIGDTPLRQITHTAPSGFENFFKESEAEFLRPGAPDMKRLFEISAKHSIYFPTLSPDDGAKRGNVALPPKIVQPGEGRKLVVFGEEVTILLGTEETGGLFTSFLDISPPGGGPPPHYHNDADEWFYVIEGRVSFFANGQWTEGGPGTAVFVPCGAVHTFKNTGDGPSKLLTHTSPSGLDKFFEETAVEFARPGGPEMDRVMEISRNRDVHFVQ